MKALVTGGGGFLGGAVVKQLLAAGWEVTSLSRQYYAKLEDLGVSQVQGDVADADAVTAAVKGCDCVFHVAAKAGVWGAWDDYYRCNVIGTQNVIQACLAAGVPKLVHTSSPSVVFNGQDMTGVDESVPYPDHFEAFYPHTKALAEQAVLAANSENLATVALRPHLIWGPEDNHLVPRIIERGGKGQLRRIGRRNCLVDTTYIDDAARAHLMAAERLAPGQPPAGRAYFISQGEPVPVWDMVNHILAAADLPPVNRTIPAGLAVFAGALLEKVYRLLRRQDEPRLTRFVAHELSTAHWFNISAARRDFGYQPQTSLQDGLATLRSWLQGCRATESS